MKIYSNQGIELLDIQVDDSSVRYRSIMSDDSLTLKFSHIEPVVVLVGSYVDFEGQRYTLWLPENFKKHNTRNFEYTITLGGWREALKLFKFKDLSAVPYRLKFSLTTKPAGFLQLIVANMNIHDSGWTAGSCIDAVERTLSFNHEYCFDVLARIAQEWSTEFEFVDKKIHLRKVEKFKDAPLPLSYGKGNGFKSGVGRTNDGDKQPIGRLYVQGGERNIDFSTYGSSSLLLPKDQALVVDGKTYRTDAHGMYITRDGNDLVAEDSFDASHIYPKRVGVVSEVVEVDAEKHFYDIKDASIPASLDYSQCRIDGEKATISFQSGALAGREFDIEQTDKALTGYDHEERLFKIVPQELDGIVMPGGAFVPAVGDQYAIFNISMPESYIADNVTKTGASWDMFRECVTYFAENEKQKFSFTGELDGIWSKSKWLEIGGKIVPGGHVLFTDEQFLPSGEVIRITAIKDYVNQPHKPEITLSNVPIGSGFSSQLGELEAGEVAIEDSYKRGQLYTKRRWRDVMETMGMLEDAMLNFDGSINPITIRTMQLIAGDESLQYRFVNSAVSPVRVTHEVAFNNETKVLTANSGIIQHMTLGITNVSSAHSPNEYLFWNMEGYASPPLVEPEKSYYLYANCNKTGGSGTFLLSETPIEINAAVNSYHFLVSVVGSERDGLRSIVDMYGFTEILPGRITTDKIVSADGKTYFDLVESVIGGNIKFLSNGVENDLGSWAGRLSDDLSGLNSQVSDFESYLEGAFKDGVISEAEAKAIETYINTIKSEKSAIEATYNKLFVNPLLTGVAKSNLLNSKIYFSGEVDSLIALINNVIADGKVTASEKVQVDTAFDNYRASYALFSQRIQEASDAIQSEWGSQLQGQIDGLDGQIGNFEDYIEGAFKDGIISAAEAKAIAAYINTIESEKAGVAATYNKLFVNPLLSGAPKSNLLNAKVSFFGQVNTLTTLINQVIADGLITAVEKNQVDSAFSDYRDSYALFSQRIQEANESIQNKIAGDASEALARANIAKAITDKFGTTIDGGLVQTVMMLLREANSETNTAGISGIQGALRDNPAFWAGGTYEQAIALISFLDKMKDGIMPDEGEYAALASNIQLHSGASKLGDLLTFENGAVVMVDPATAKPRLIFNVLDLPKIEDLVGGVSSAGTIDIGPGFTSGSVTLSGIANVTQSNGVAQMGSVTINLSASGRKQLTGMSSFVSAELNLYQGSSKVANIGAAGIFFTNDFDLLETEEHVIPARSLFLSGAGNYTFKLEIIKEGYVSSANSQSTSFTFSWNASLAGVKRQQYGRDGMMFFYSNNHFHYTEGNGLDIRGKTNMPGVLASGTISTGGVLSNEWGAKVNYGQTITGGYRIFLKDMTHNKYSVQITPHTNVTFRAGTKTNTYFEILGTGAADFIVIGSNY